MVTRVTRDLLDIGRPMPDGRGDTGIDINEDMNASFKVTGNASTQFHMDGVPIGMSIGATNADAKFKEVIITDILDITGATVLGVSGTVPIGGIIMYNGLEVNIPSNFQLCDGTGITPDMTDKFVYGTTTFPEILDSGGTADAVVVQHNHGINDPGHAHTQQAARENGNDGSRSGNTSRATFNNIAVNSNTTGISIQNEGVSGVDQNLPPYIKLAFIQRMS